VLAVIREGGGLPAGGAVCDVAVLKDSFGTPIDGRDFEGMKLGCGERGEVAVCGPQVLRGYLDGQGDEETKIRVGDVVWHRTGDAGWIDESGMLWLVGRCQAKIVRDDEVIYPLAVEAAVRLVFPGRKMALIEVGDQVVMVIEGEMPEGFETKVAELGCERVVLLERLPMDRRHQSKIDYPVLQRLVGGR